MRKREANDDGKFKFTLTEYKLISTDICVYNSHIHLHRDVIWNDTFLSCFNYCLIHYIHSGQLSAILSACSLRHIAAFFRFLFLICHTAIATNQSLDAPRITFPLMFLLQLQKKKINLRTRLLWYKQEIINIHKLARN